MLTITDTARIAIESILAGTADPDHSGLRIAKRVEDGALALSIQDSPIDGDDVIGSAGALVFVESEAAAALDGKVLDASAGPTGAVEFRIAQ